MTIIDKFYYLVYCAERGGSDKPWVNKSDSQILPPNVRATNWLAMIVIFYVFDFTKYTGLVFLVDKNIRFKVAILMGISVLVIVNYYFSFSGRDSNIIKYYSQRRAGAQKADSRLGFLIWILGFIMLIAYGWVGRNIIPLPIFFKDLAN